MDEKLFEKGIYGDDYVQAVFTIRRLYVKLINASLIDGNGERHYDNKSHNSMAFLDLSAICLCLNSLASDYTLNIHSLNHDIVIEGLSRTQWLKHELSDGFTELGSPYFGEIRNSDGRVYKVRLEQYDGVYDKQINLYKLHGSIDYLLFSDQNGISGLPENYLKTRYGVGYSELYKEKKGADGRLEYFNCWINDHPDFLSGTTQKILRYEEPLLYKKLFDHFKENLKVADKLVIIGYGGSDSEVNKMLEDDFDFKNKESIIIDANPGEGVVSLSKALGAKLVSKSLEDVVVSDFSY